MKQYFQTEVPYNGYGKENEICGYRSKAAAFPKACKAPLARRVGARSEPTGGEKVRPNVSLRACQEARRVYSRAEGSKALICSNAFLYSSESFS